MAKCQDDPTESFSQFSLLLTELRLQIWILVLTDISGRTVELKLLAHPNPYELKQVSVQTPTSPLATLLGTNHESRYIALKRYTHIIASSGTGSLSGLFDYEDDSFSIPSPDAFKAAQWNLTDNFFKNVRFLTITHHDVDIHDHFARWLDIGVEALRGLRQPL